MKAWHLLLQNRTKNTTPFVKRGGKDVGSTRGRNYIMQGHEGCYLDAGEHSVWAQQIFRHNKLTCWKRPISFDLQESLWLQTLFYFLGHGDLINCSRSICFPSFELW